MIFAGVDDMEEGSEGRQRMTREAYRAFLLVYILKRLCCEKHLYIIYRYNSYMSLTHSLRKCKKPLNGLLLQWTHRFH